MALVLPAPSTGGPTPAPPPPEPPPAPTSSPATTSTTAPAPTIGLTPPAPRPLLAQAPLSELPDTPCPGAAAAAPPTPQTASPVNPSTDPCSPLPDLLSHGSFGVDPYHHEVQPVEDPPVGSHVHGPSKTQPEHHGSSEEEEEEVELVDWDDDDDDDFEAAPLTAPDTLGGEMLARLEAGCATPPSGTPPGESSAPALAAPARGDAEAPARLKSILVRPAAPSPVGKQGPNRGTGKSSGVKAAKGSCPRGLVGHCFRCLALDHRVAQCRDPVRCLRCGGVGHIARHCAAARNSLARHCAAARHSHGKPISSQLQSRLSFPPENIHSRISFPPLKQPSPPQVSHMLITPATPQLPMLQLHHCPDSALVAVRAPVEKTKGDPDAFRRHFVGRCYRCLSHDHRIAQCRDQVRCLRCLGVGHISRTCPTRRPSRQMLHSPRLRRSLSPAPRAWTSAATTLQRLSPVFQTARLDPLLELDRQLGHVRGCQPAAFREDDPMLHEFQLAQAFVAPPGRSTTHPKGVSGGEPEITFGPDMQLAEQTSDEVNNTEIDAAPLASAEGRSDSPNSIVVDDLAGTMSVAAAKNIVDEHADLQGAKDTHDFCSAIFKSVPEPLLPCPAIPPMYVYSRRTGRKKKNKVATRKSGAEDTDCTTETEDIGGCVSFCRKMFREVPEPLLPRPASPPAIKKQANRSSIRGRRRTQAPSRSSQRQAARPSSVPVAQRAQLKLRRELDFINGEPSKPSAQDAAITEYVDKFGQDIPEEAIKALRIAAKLDNKELCMALATIAAEVEVDEMEVL